MGGGVAQQSRVCPALLDDLSSPSSHIKKLITILNSRSRGIWCSHVNISI